MSDYINYNDLTDEDILAVINEHYYSIGVTGAEAIENLRDDIPSWVANHGVPQERMEKLLTMFEGYLTAMGWLNKTAGW